MIGMQDCNRKGKVYSDQYIEFVEFFGDIEWIEKERNPNQ